MRCFKFLLMLASASFFIVSAQAQNAGTVISHAFAIGKGVGVQGYTSLLCTSAQLAVGQTSADPICKTITGDVTITAAGVTAIGAGRVLNPMLAALGSGVTLGGVTMGLGSDASGDIYYNNGGIFTRLPKGANGQTLQLVTGLPAWVTLAGTGTVTSAQISAGAGITVTTTSGANPCVATCNLTIAVNQSV
jgi:hypothetical protein